MSIFNEDLTSISEDDANRVTSTSVDYHDSDDTGADDGAEDRAPLSEAETKALNDALPSHQGQSPFANVVPVEDGPKGEWIPPRVRQARRKARILPSAEPLHDGQRTLSEITARPFVPQPVLDAVAGARKVLAESIETHDKARHPELPRSPRNPEARQAAVDAIEAGKAAVARAVDLSRSEAMVTEQRAAIVAGIEPAKDRAAAALDEATAAFTEWRNLVDQARELAIATGEFGPSWHQHPEERSTNPRGLIGDLRRARDLAHTEDPFLSGEYLVEDPTPEGEVPAWTAAALAKMPQDSFGWQVLARLRMKHEVDGPVAEALASKDLRPIYDQPVPALSPSARGWEATLAPYRA